MAAWAPSSSAGEPDPNTTNLRPPSSSYDWSGVAHGCTRKLGMKICGFLQKNNNVDEKSRIVGAFTEQPSPKNLLTRDNERGVALQTHRDGLLQPVRQGFTACQEW
ncbi:hypothetical protein AOLI_G00086580 [Acnodon oligacanthus]